ncbi:MAG: hypothetical protein WD342_08165 [Verrucomicrobiales bacterium]
MAAFLPEAGAPALLAFDAHGLKSLKFVSGLLLLPLCWALLETFLVLLRADTLGASHWKSREFIAFVLGCFFWMVLFFGFRSRSMMWLYVAGHELTHALFVFLCRGKVAKVHISADGGHILTNRNNFVISLSPYFFPFYTALAILAWGLVGWVLEESGRPEAIWLYASIGVTWMFHLTFTLWMVRRDQPDVDQNGRLFSFTLIFLVNVLIICAMLIVASPTATFHGFALSFWDNSGTLASRLVESVQELYRALPI